VHLAGKGIDAPSRTTLNPSRNESPERLETVLSPPLILQRIRFIPALRRDFFIIGGIAPSLEFSGKSGFR
jgi:hypothetical protein